MLPDPRATVAAIEAILQGANLPSGERVRELGRQYRQAVEEANRRLVLCDEYLARSRACEAMHLADQYPSLIETVGQLSFQRRDDWLSLCRDHDTDPGAPPRLESVAELVEARRRAARAETLLKLLRKSCLRREPVSRRLEILRKLRQIESESPLWTDQVKKLETIRLREIEAILKLGDNQRDRIVLEALRAELDPAIWLDRQGRVLAEFVAERLEVIAAVRRNAAFESLAGEIHEAHASLDPDRLTEARARWDDLLRSGPPAIDLEARISDAIRWHEAEIARAQETRRFEATIAELETALAGGLSSEAVRGILDRARSFRREIPEHLEGRYRRIEAQVQQEATRRVRLKLAGIGFAAAAVIVVVVVASSSMAAAREREAWRSNLAVLIRAERFEEAVEVVAKLHESQPKLLADPAIEALAAKAEQAVAAAHRQRDELARVLDLARRSVEAGTLGPELGSTFKQADALARTDEDRRRIEQLRHESRLASVEHDRKQSEDFFRTLEIVRGSLGGLRDDLTAGGDGYAARREKLSSAVAELARLSQGDPKLEAAEKELHQELDHLDARIAEIERKAAEEDRALAEILAGTPTLKVHFDRLKAYLAAFPKARAAIDVQQVLLCRTGNEAVVAWRDLVPTDVDPFAFDAARLPDDRAASLRLAVNAFLAAYGQSAPAPGVRALGDHLRCLEEIRSKPGQRARDLLLERLTVGSVCNVYTIRHVNLGPIFFEKDGCRVEGDNVVVELAYPVDGLGEGTKTLARIKFQSVTPELTPHSVLARRLIAIMREAEVDWQRFPLRALKEIRDAQDALPELRRLLLDWVLDATPRTLKADPAVRPIAELAGRLRARYETRLSPWFTSFHAPESEELKATLDRDLPDGDTILRDVSVRQHIAVASALRRVDLAGVLVKGGLGWRLASSAALATDRELWIVGLSGFIRVGTTRPNGEVAWLSPEATCMRQCSPVFSPVDGATEAFLERVSSGAALSSSLPGVWPTPSPDRR